MWKQLTETKKIWNKVHEEICQFFSQVIPPHLVNTDVNKYIPLASKP